MNGCCRLIIWMLISACYLLGKSFIILNFVIGSIEQNDTEQIMRYLKETVVGQQKRHFLFVLISKLKFPLGFLVHNTWQENRKYKEVKYG